MAPRDGVVITKNVEEGTVVPSSRASIGSTNALLQIGDVSRLWVVTKVDETDIAQVKNGRHYPAIAGWGPLESVYLKNLGNMFDIVSGVKGKYSPLSIKQAMDAAAQEADQVLSSSR